jgi:hypothetical protein
MEFRREAPTLLAAAAPPDPRLDEELAFIEVSNALAALAPTKSRSIAPTSPWVVRSVAAVPCVPYVATPEGAGENRLMVVTALLAMLVGIPVAALAISFIY